MLHEDWRGLLLIDTCQPHPREHRPSSLYGVVLSVSSHSLVSNPVKNWETVSLAFWQRVRLALKVSLVDTDLDGRSYSSTVSCLPKLMERTISTLDTWLRLLDSDLVTPDALGGPAMVQISSPGSDLDAWGAVDRILFGTLREHVSLLDQISRSKGTWDLVIY